MNFLRKLTFNSAGFKMQGAEDLSAFKDFLHDSGYSEVNNPRTIRNYITIEDKTFLTAQRAMSQRLWYMQKLFPALYILLELLAFLIPFILIRLRRRESALMRAQGASKHTAFSCLFTEQMILCLTGAIVGAGIWYSVFRSATGQGFLLASIFTLLWLAGTGAAAFSLNPGSIRNTLKAAE